MSSHRTRNIILVIVAILVVAAVGVWLWGTRTGSAYPQQELAFAPSVNPTDISFGSEKAPLTVVMYGTYTCKHCIRFFNEGMPALQPLIDSGQVRLVLKLVGLTADPLGKRANRTAVCIARYGSFEALHRMFVYDFGLAYTAEFAEMVEEFIAADPLVAECMLGGEAQGCLDEANAEFRALKLSGTPVFAIGQTAYTGFPNARSLLGVVREHLHKK